MRAKLRCFTILLLLTLPAAVQAQFNFTTNNGSITINQYTGAGGDVVIPDTITGLKVATVAQDAFNQVFNLTSVTFGTNVATIAQNCVFQCSNLAAVSLPASVTNIGQGPFYDCKSLTTISLSLSNSFFSVTNGVLFNKSLTSLIQLPSGATGSYTLSAAITNFGLGLIGNSLSALAVDPANPLFSSTNGVVFSRNKTLLYQYPGALAGIYIVPTNVTYIISAAFEYATGITGVFIGTNVTTIGYVAFYDCANLTAITVNPTNAFYTSTNGVLFDKNQTTLFEFPTAIGGTYVIPGTVLDIADGAFGDDIGLTTVVIPNSVTNIGFESFYNCEGLANLTIGAGVKNITQDAFFLCPALTTLVIPASVTNIGFEAFADCQNLSGVCFSGNAPVDGGSIFYFDNSLSSILYVSTATGWGPVYDGILTSPCTTCGGTAPELDITRSGNNVILSWSTDFPTYTLQSATNLVSPITWSAVAGQYSVTNPITGKAQFYRLTSP